MAIPNEPYTRKEQYLNAMATGNASGVPDTPYTREEMYLDAIAKGGGGGTGGNVLVVHSVNNTLDKTWQEIYDAMLNGVAVRQETNPLARYMILAVANNTKAGSYDVIDSSGLEYAASSADGYPARNM